MINYVNVNKYGRGIQGFTNRCYTYESNQPNLALGGIIKTLQPLSSFLFIFTSNKFR